jgi:hypothetical protein
VERENRNKRKKIKGRKEKKEIKKRRVLWTFHLLQQPGEIVLPCFSNLVKLKLEKLFIREATTGIVLTGTEAYQTGPRYNTLGKSTSIQSSQLYRGITYSSANL